MYKNKRTPKDTVFIFCRYYVDEQIPIDQIDKDHDKVALSDLSLDYKTIF